MSNHTPSTDTVLDCFLDGAAGDFVAEDFYTWFQAEKAKVFRAGTEAFAAQLLQPLPEDGIRPPIVNPYES